MVHPLDAIPALGAQNDSVRRRSALVVGVVLLVAVAAVPVDAMVAAPVGAVATPGNAAGDSGGLSDVGSSSQSGGQVANPVDSCTTITESGKYRLTEDLVNRSAKTCIEIEASDVWFEGGGHVVDGTENERGDFFFTNFSTAGIAANASGERLTNVSVWNVTVSNWFNGVELTRVDNGGVVNATISGVSSGVFVNSSQGVGVRKNDISNVSWGVQVLNTSYSLVENNTARNAIWGVDLIAGWNVGQNLGYTHNVTVIGNDVINNSYGVSVSSSRDNYVLENTATENEYGFSTDGATRNEFVNNVATANTYRGFEVSYVNNSTFVRNTADGNGRGGFLVSNAHDNTFRENTANRNGFDGFFLENATGNLLEDNTIEGTRGIAARAGPSSAVWFRNASENRLVGNTLRANANWSVYATGDSTNTAENVTIGTATVSFDATDVAVRPADPPRTVSGRFLPDGAVGVKRVDDDGRIRLGMQYGETAPDVVNESTLGLWRFDDGAWSPVPGSTGNATTDVVTATVEDLESDASVFAPVGEVRRLSPRRPPARPERLTLVVARQFVEAYEETRKSNEILSATEAPIPEIDVACRPTTAAETSDGFRVTLDCGFSYVTVRNGTVAIADGAPYEVTYLVNDTATARVSNRSAPGVSNGSASDSNATTRVSDATTSVPGATKARETTTDAEPRETATDAESRETTTGVVASPFDGALLSEDRSLHFEWRPPTDVDGDGRYEDVNGDSRFDLRDVAALAIVDVATDHFGLELTAEQVASFDFDGDGDLDSSDVLALASESS